MSVMSWTFNGQTFIDDMIGDNVGFVYIIRHAASGRYYIGQKKFHSIRTLPPLKNQTRKRKVKTVSDYQSYFGSSVELNALVSVEGKGAFTREILYLCQTKSEMNYIETIIQVKSNVIFDPLSFNAIVNFRVSRKHLSKANTIVQNLALNSIASIADPDPALT
ncbi:hypothetical protein [Cereibacter changlensis]|uniref:hypothetical protein n=1 Tax=Cereibacter changlensis TaxID=402884 RepID=UPI004033922A